jgi:3'-phosphoadenosine 5'-phosphosulfate sulfotransferase (PAPS reductase)/FAD synthetase
MEYKTQYLPINNLIINPNNPRLIKDANFKRLVKSLKDCPSLFDARPCICSDRTGELIIMGGNMRLLAAKELQYKEVPVIIMSGLTEAQEKEIVIKDNGDFGEWDMNLLSSWDNLPLNEWGVNLPEDWLSGNKKEGGKEKAEASPYKNLSPIEIDEKTQELIDKAEKILFQFSGGKDSSLSIIKTLPLVQGKDYEAVYVDTGTEFPDLLYHVVTFCEGYNVPLKVLKPKKDFFEIYSKKKKFPDTIFRDCIAPLINNPVDKFTEELKKDCLIIRGGRVNQKTSRGKNDFYKEFKVKKDVKKLLNPMMYMKEEEYKKEIEQIPKWPGYEKGFVRTACWCCPFQTVAQWEALKQFYPFCWEAMKEMARTWEYPSHKDDSTIKRFKKYWDSQC